MRDGFNFGTRQSFDALVEMLQQRKCILFAGSGLSKQYSDKFPNWKTLIENIANHLSENTNGDTMQMISELIQQNKLLVAAEACRRRIPPQNYVKFFQEELQNPLSLPGNANTHILITEMPFVAILTTNYDQLIEKIYKEKNKGVPVYTQIDAPSMGTLLQPLRSSKGEKPIFILKVHGDLTKPDTWVLTLDDYRKIIMKNPAYRFFIRNLLTQFSVLFVGFSLDDPDFQLLLLDVMDAFEGEIPDHFLLLPNLSFIEQEVLYRTYRVRVLPFEEYDKLPNMLFEINSAVNEPPVSLPKSPTLEDVKKFVKRNENFEDSAHRKTTLGESLQTILQVFDDTLSDPGLDVDSFISLIEIERILTHHVYLFPEIPIRRRYAPALIAKAKELHNQGKIKNFKKELEEHAWMLYLVAIEDIGFPLVRNIERDPTNGKKNADALRKISTQVDEIIQLMTESFNLIPNSFSRGEELRAACYYHRIHGLKMINLLNQRSGFSYLEKALILAQRANWESIEAALLQDIVRPEPNPWADEVRLKKIKENSKQLAIERTRTRESIELARYKGMHRRVTGGLVALSLLANGDDRVKHIKYASDYYLLHQVDQEPLEAMIFAEETIALNEVGYLTSFETEYRVNWLLEGQKRNMSKPRYQLLNPLFQNKLKKILNLNI